MDLAEIKELQEDAQERKQFDSELCELYDGSAMVLIASHLEIMSAMFPPQGSLSMKLAIFSNALMRELRETKALESDYALLLETHRESVERVNKLNDLVGEASKFFSPLHDFDGEKLEWLECADAIRGIPVKEVE